jgi:N-acetylneuraminate synthase
MKKININGREISRNTRPYIIAELSANHNGSIERAFDTISAAKKAGADAIKLQTYTPDTITLQCDKPDFQIKGGLWDGYTLYELYKEAQTPFEWHKPLFEHARKTGITVFSSPFDSTAVDLLEDLNTPAYKIASFEAIDIPLITYVAQTGKPMIISTGMANAEEIEEAVNCARDNGCTELALLHCVSSYPAPADQYNLRTIADLAQRFNVVSGLSDHTLGNITAITAVSTGASIVEKHFILSRAEGGPDSAFSIEPLELEHLCRDCHTAWQALGVVTYERQEAEKANLQFRRSIYAVKDIAAGEQLTEENIRSIRPGYGLRPAEYSSVLGKSARTPIQAGTPLRRELFS